MSWISSEIETCRIDCPFLVVYSKIKNWYYFGQAVKSTPQDIHHRSKKPMCGIYGMIPGIALVVWDTNWWRNLDHPWCWYMIQNYHGILLGDRRVPFSRTTRSVPIFAGRFVHPDAAELQTSRNGHFSSLRTLVTSKTPPLHLVSSCGDKAWCCNS